MHSSTASIISAPIAYRAERRRARAVSLAIGVACISLVLALPAAAQEYTAARKVGRGLAGMTLGVLEIPGNVVQETRNNGAVSGVTIGLAVGLGKFVARTLVGVYEFLSAPFPAPPGFAPVLEPEFPWQYFDGGGAGPYDFGGGQLGSAADQIQEIPGVSLASREGVLVVRFPGDLLFALGSSDLSSTAQLRLRELASILESHPGLKASVHGFTDSTGSEAGNLALSGARAETVRMFLAERGVASERIASKGFGSAQPVASNATVEGRRKNRRVDVLLRSGGVATFR